MMNALNKLGGRLTNCLLIDLLSTGHNGPVMKLLNAFGESGNQLLLILYMHACRCKRLILMELYRLRPIRKAYIVNPRCAPLH